MISCRGGRGDAGRLQSAKAEVWVAEAVHRLEQAEGWPWPRSGHHRLCVALQHFFCAEDHCAVLLLERCCFALDQYYGQLANLAMPEEAMLPAAGPLLDAVFYLHDKLKILHRDIKPANLLLRLRTDGPCIQAFPFSLLLGDFGGACAANSPPTEQCVTTTPYAPPEVLQLRPEYTPASDWWSVGIILLEMASRNPTERAMQLTKATRGTRATREAHSECKKLAQTVARLAAQTVPPDMDPTSPLTTPTQLVLQGASQLVIVEASQRCTQMCDLQLAQKWLQLCGAPHLERAALALTRYHILMAGVRGSTGVRWLRTLVETREYIWHLRTGDLESWTSMAKNLAEKFFTEHSKKWDDPFWACHKEGNHKFWSGHNFMAILRDKRSLQCFNACARDLMPTVLSMFQARAAHIAVRRSGLATGTRHGPANIPSPVDDQTALAPPVVRARKLLLDLAARGFASKGFQSQIPELGPMQEAFNAMWWHLVQDIPEECPACPQPAPQTRLAHDLQIFRGFFVHRVTEKKGVMQRCTCGPYLNQHFIRTLYLMGMNFGLMDPDHNLTEQQWTLLRTMQATGRGVVQDPTDYFGCQSAVAFNDFRAEVGRVARSLNAYALPAQGGCQPTPLTNECEGKPLTWVLLPVVLCEAKQTINLFELRALQAVLNSNESDYTAPVQKKFAWLMQHDPGVCHMCSLLQAAVHAVAPHMPVRKAKFPVQIRLHGKTGPQTLRQVHRKAMKQRKLVVKSVATQGHPSQGARGKQPGARTKLAVAPEEAARTPRKAKSNSSRSGSTPESGTAGPCQKCLCKAPPRAPNDVEAPSRMQVDRPPTTSSTASTPTSHHATPGIQCNMPAPATPTTLALGAQAQTPHTGEKLAQSSGATSDPHLRVHKGTPVAHLFHYWPA